MIFAENQSERRSVGAIIRRAENREKIRQLSRSRESWPRVLQKAVRQREIANSGQATEPCAWATSWESFSNH